ncbi:hypothetical protein BDR06DRAFT_972641 [Suillus hirtellus]|nr:hypothetical protein BDR06DRAFT_972641 [Suillus hirtellus]
MAAAVCEWVLHQYETGYFVKSKFLPEENMHKKTKYLNMFNNMSAESHNPRVFTNTKHRKLGLPNVNEEEINCTHAVQLWYESEALEGQLTNQESLQKIEFRIPLNTTNTNKSTTYVNHFHTKSDLSPLDMFNSMRATMDLPKTYEHLGWRLSTAHHMDPLHRLLTAQDIKSAFKAAKAKQLSGQHKKNVAIEVINTASRTIYPVHPSLATVKMFISHVVRKELHPFTPQPLKRMYALYLESDEDTDDEEPSQGINEVLAKIHSCYPDMNLPQYMNTLKKHEKVGISEGATFTFHTCIAKTHMKDGHVKWLKKVSQYL